MTSLISAFGWSDTETARLTCVCANNPDAGGVYDAFTKRFVETAGAMKVADGFEPGAVIGPLIDMKAVEKVEAHIADALKKGATVVTGGKRSALGGTFFEPTVLTDVTTDMVLTKEETFWPVAPAAESLRRARISGRVCLFARQLDRACIHERKDRKIGKLM